MTNQRKGNKVKTERVSFRSEEAVIEKVSKICEESGLNKSAVLRFALEHGVCELAGEIAGNPEYNIEAVMKAMWLGIEINQMDDIRKI